MGMLSIMKFVGAGVMFVPFASGIASGATIELITNGDFEANDGDQINAPANQTAANTEASKKPTGWTTLTSKDANPGHAFVLGNIGATGNNVVDFNGYDVTPNGILTQSITTTIGATYTFNYQTGFVGTDNTQCRLDVRVVGAGGVAAPLAQQSVVIGTPGTEKTTATLYNRPTITFVADSTTTIIRYEDTSGTGGALGVTGTRNSGPQSQDPIIDNVSVKHTTFGSLLDQTATSGLKGTANVTGSNGSYKIGEAAITQGSNNGLVGHVDVTGSLTQQPVFVLLDINGTTDDQTARDAVVASLTSAVTATGQFLAADISDTPNSSAAATSPSYVLSRYQGGTLGNYDIALKFTTSDANGIFQFDYDLSGISGVTSLNYVGIVPEPTSVAVMGLGSLGVMASRRRRKV